MAIRGRRLGPLSPAYQVCKVTDSLKVYYGAITSDSNDKKKRRLYVTHELIGGSISWVQFRGERYGFVSLPAKTQSLKKTDEKILPLVSHLQMDYNKSLSTSTLKLEPSSLALASTMKCG